MQGLNLSQPGLKHDPHWFRTAVFYEVLVRAFADSKGSGAGDFTGLVQRLDYLQWLGIDCLWLPPFYASPLRDGGYDISDYTAVLPEFGTLPEFTELVSQAHARGIRIVTDLVMNHTSDQHPWFQASRADPEGPYGDFYVWSDNDEKYADARIIFVDTEVSNWTFDPIRRQFFWHRFFSHQPDLNFENPDVQEAMFDIVRFWMDLGIDGFRLDAVPYLFEEEGTNCENLPRTHEFLAKLRAMVDEEYPGRVLLAEANQLPSEVVRLLRHRGRPRVPDVLPLPRDAAAVLLAARGEGGADHRRAGRHPADPARHASGAPSCATTTSSPWRWSPRRSASAMYGWYAPDPRMRANVGIRRRLAPLLDNSRAEIELIHALVLSLPGSPCLYYGDEIGMGDNIWLNDRDAVRTPMQWTPDRNSGFSSVDPGKLYLPVISSLVYHYDNINVEAQIASSSSLLHWLRGMLQIRSRHPVFGLGSFEVCPAENDTILAFLRTVDGSEFDDVEAETVLCVNNMSSRPQASVIRLPDQLKGAAVVDLFGGSGFPSVTDEATLTITTGSRDFFWLRLIPRRQP